MEFRTLADKKIFLQKITEKKKHYISCCKKLLFWKWNDIVNLKKIREKCYSNEISLKVFSSNLCASWSCPIISHWSNISDDFSVTRPDLKKNRIWDREEERKKKREIERERERERDRKRERD